MRVPSVAELHYISGSAALCQHIRIEPRSRKSIYLRVTSKYFPVIGAKIPVNVPRNFRRKARKHGVRPSANGKKGEIRNLPVNSVTPISTETGSRLTAHTTIQSSQTAHFVGDSKEGGFCGSSPYRHLDFLSLWTSAVSRAGFWPPVSASRIPFLAAGFRRAKGRSRLGNRDSGRQKCRFEPWP